MTPPATIAADLRHHLAIAAEARRRGDFAAATIHETEAARLLHAARHPAAISMEAAR